MKRYSCFWDNGLGGLCYRRFWFKKNAIKFARSMKYSFVQIRDTWKNEFLTFPKKDQP